MILPHYPDGDAFPGTPDGSKEVKNIAQKVISTPESTEASVNQVM